MLLLIMNVSFSLYFLMPRQFINLIIRSQGFYSYYVNIKPPHIRKPQSGHYIYIYIPPPWPVMVNFFVIKLSGLKPPRPVMVNFFVIKLSGLKPPRPVMVNFFVVIFREIVDFCRLYELAISASLEPEKG